MRNNPGGLLDQAILVSDSTIKSNPALVQKLVDATLKGLKDMVN